MSEAEESMVVEDSSPLEQSHQVGESDAMEVDVNNSQLEVSQEVSFADLASPKDDAADPEQSAAQSNFMSKPIPKRNLFEDNHQDESQDNQDQAEDDGMMKKLQENGREDLRAFLIRNRVDEKAADDYEISVRFTKGGRQKNRDGTFTRRSEGIAVSYIAPNGALLISKTDVLIDFQERNTRQRSSKSDGQSNKRNDIHEAAKQKLNGVDLPLYIGRDIKVFSFGRIDTRSGFHSPVQVYPIGYRCEQTVVGTTLQKGSSKQLVICEIKEHDGFPEFVITSKTSDNVFVASTEAAVWRQFNYCNIDKDWKPSFFNIEIELLLEGLDGVLDCEEYKFHFERGYRKQYNTQEDSQNAKEAFLAKLLREKRMQDRQKTRHLTKEEQDRLVELQRRKDEEEARAKKQQMELLKVRKDKGKEEYKKEKEEIRQQEVQRKEQQKKEELEKKEKNKAMEKAQKEELKKNDKLRQQYRKEILQEIRKTRTDAAATVLQSFDDEENQEQHLDMVVDMATLATKIRSDTSASSSAPIRSDNLQSLLYEELRPMKECESLIAGWKQNGYFSDSNWDDLIVVASTLNVVRSLLKFEQNIDLDQLIRCCGGELIPTSTAVTTVLSESIESKNNDEDEEWDEPAVRTRKGASSGGELNAQQRVEREAELDRVQLNVLQQLLAPLHTTLDLDQKDLPATEPNRRDRRQAAIKLPLNQLTWVELARMILLHYLYRETGSGDEDIRHVLRGSKQPSYRIMKNIVRNIRYRWYIRNKLPARPSVLKVVEKTEAMHAEDRMMLINALVPAAANKQIIRFDNIQSNSESDNLMLTKERPPQNLFNSEEDLIDELQKMASDVNTPEVYRRCCKVLLRILNLTVANNFIWEIDAESYSDYYDTVIRPVAFVNVASNLVSRAYDEKCHDDTEIARAFYTDIRQVSINCITYSTEAALIVAPAQRMLLTIYRHFDRWLLSPHKPSIDLCDEKYCFLTGEVLGANKSISLKCGKCAALYNLDAVENIFLGEDPVPESMRSLQDFFVVPTDEIVNQVNEEWHCPFCLQEDFQVLCENIDKRVIPDVHRTAFYVDEWGPSANLPWLFNPAHSHFISRMKEREPFLLHIVDAIKILGDSHLSPFTSSNESQVKTWTFAERVKVLQALCTVLQSMPTVFQHIEKVHDDCDKLAKVCNKASFREGEFMSMVRNLCGEDAVLYCRSLLDGIGSEATADGNQQVAVEGRCMLCNGSTFEEDMLEGDSEEIKIENQVILCDGCNGEAHLGCLNLTAVPSSAWFCSPCSVRQSRREKVNENSHLENFENARHKEEEDKIIAKYVDQKITGDDDGDSAIKCAYCGLLEQDLCSPLVYGQSRDEHEAWVQLCKVPMANSIFDSESRNTVISFVHEGKKMSAPKLSFPFFPPISSSDGEELLKRYDACGQTPVITHQMCALQMFQARLNRKKHELRRRRKVVGQRVEAMTGVFLQPLGQDRFQNEYWKFPFSKDLFICRNNNADDIYVDKDKEDFKRMLEGGHGDHQALDYINSSKHWMKVSETEHILQLVERLEKDAALNPLQSRSANSLKVNIINSILSERMVLNPNANAMAPEDQVNKMQIDEAITESAASAHVEDVETKVETTKKVVDNNPVALKLFTNKGPDIFSMQYMDEEKVFEEQLDEDEEEDQSLKYFQFSGKKYYAIGLVNAAGSLIKMGNANAANKRTVLMHIYREGISTPLSSVDLADAWSDHFYYFSCLTFKKSGKYTISFLLQGNVSAPSSIKPLVYNVTVEARSIRCGIPDALDRLAANKFLQAEHRQVYSGRGQLLQVVRNPQDEATAVKAALLTLFLALPNGSLSGDAASESVTSRGRLNKEESLLAGLLEATSWNSVLEQSWCGMVMNASSPTTLMECLLVLEFYITKGWLTASHSKLFQALPSSHFALRCCTYSSVAMRVYCLDKVIAYDKVQVPPREKRGYSRASADYDVYEQAPTSSSKSGRQSTSRKVEESKPAKASSGTNARSQRTAAHHATQRMSKQKNVSDDEEVEEEEEEANEESEEDDDEEDEEDDEEGDDDGASDGSEVIKTSSRSPWICALCTTDNDAHARTCETCGKRKVVASSASGKRKSSDSRQSHGQGRKRSRNDDDDEEEPSRRSSRGRGSKSYRESDEEEEEVMPKSRRAKIEDDDEEEVDFDQRGNVSKAENKVVAKKVKRKSPEEEFQEYKASIPQQMEAFGSYMTEHRQAFMNLPASEMDMNIRFFSILRRMKRDERTFLFWEPVDLVAIPAYSRYVRNPMDLGTITDRVKKNYYKGSKSSFQNVGRLLVKYFCLPWSKCVVFVCLIGFVVSVV